MCALAAGLWCFRRFRILLPITSWFVVRVRGALWLGDMPYYEVIVRDFCAFPERVTPSVRIAPWPVVGLAQVYSSLTKGIWRLNL